jgi:signal transduction histidine kinase
MDDKGHFESHLTALHEQLNSTQAPQARLEALLELQFALENALTAQEEQFALLEEAQTLATAHGLQDALPRIKYALARWYFHQSNYASAVVYAREAYDALPEDALELRFRTLNLIGNIHHMTGDYIGALAIFRRFLELKDRYNISQYEGWLRVNIAVIYMRMKKWEQALEETLLALEEMKRRTAPDMHKHIINAYENASHYASELGDGERALRLIQEGIAYTRQHGLPVTNTAMMLVGRSYHVLGDYEASERAFLQAMQITDGAQGDFWWGYLKHMMGRLYSEMGRDADAESYLQQALQHFMAVNMLDELSSVHELLYQFYRSRRQAERALYHHEQYHALTTRFVAEQREAMLHMSSVAHDAETAKLLHKMEEARAQALQGELEARKRNEQRALELAIEREKVRLLSEFVSHTSHDLRTPLAVIKTNAYLARRVTDPERQQGYLDKIDAQVTHLNMLISTMQTMVKLDTEVAYDAHPVALADIINAILGAEATRIAQHQHRIVLDLPTNLPRLYGSVEYLKIALAALLTNAILYTPDGGDIRLSAHVVAPSLLCVTVQDNGIGIPPENLPYIFERFYKVDEARRKNESGFGFGLTMAKRIIEAHGGTITAESTPNVGSIFRVYLPLAPTT